MSIHILPPRVPTIRLSHAEFNFLWFTGEVRNDHRLFFEALTWKLVHLDKDALARGAEAGRKEKDTKARKG